MDDPNEHGAGWTFAKVLGLVLGLIGMVGFGVCSVVALVFGAQDREMLNLVAMFSIPGLVIAALCFLLARAMVRRARKPPSPGS